MTYTKYIYIPDDDNNGREQNTRATDGLSRTAQCTELVDRGARGDNMAAQMTPAALESIQ